jgi:integrase
LGESRHEAKARAKEQGSKVDTIHSYKTYEAYKQASKTFSKWLKLEFPEIKDINAIDKDIGAMYIKYRAQSGCSAYTYSQDIAMINKCLDLRLTKSHCGVVNRSLGAITKGKIDNGFRTATGAVETIIKGTGLRRNELRNLKKENLLISNGKVVGVRVITGAKGGRSRMVEVRGEFQEPIFKLVESLQDNERVLQEHISKQLQTHRLRAQFAKAKFIELKSLGREDPLQDLTQSMGHNRVSILAHYGVKSKK